MSDLTRRDFIKTGAVLGASATAISSLLTSSEADEPKPVFGSFIERPVRIRSWQPNPAPPVHLVTDGFVVILECPCANEETHRTLCRIERHTDPNATTGWQVISDPNGSGTTLEPFDGSIVVDEVTSAGDYYYRGYAEYQTGDTPIVSAVIGPIQVV